MNSVMVVHGGGACARSEGGAFTIMAGQRGAPGQRGADGSAGGQTVTRQAGEEVSALRVVYESQARAYLIDPESDTSLQMLGISLTTGSAGADLTVQTIGAIDEPSWKWSQGPVFAGPSGTLTQIPPTTGWELVVGFASSPTRINIDFREPVFLA